MKTLKEKIVKILAGINELPRTNYEIADQILELLKSEKAKWRRKDISLLRLGKLFMIKNKKGEYKFKRWWWRWFKPEGWDSDWLFLKIAQMNEAKNSVFIEQQKKRILEKYFVKR